jgi:hypothetical protein
MKGRPPHTEEKQEGDTSLKVLGMLVSTGVVGLLVAGALDVRKDASIALSVVEQHGQELLLIRGELNQLRKDMLDRTVSRYTAEEQEQYAKYLESRLSAIEKQLDRCCKNR